MDTKLLASITFFALLAGIISISMMQSVYAADYVSNDKPVVDKKVDNRNVVEQQKAYNEAANYVPSDKAMTNQKAADLKADL